MFGPADASSPSAAAGLDCGEAPRGSERRRNFVVALGFDCVPDDSWSDGCGGYGAGFVDHCSGCCGAAE